MQCPACQHTDPKVYVGLNIIECTNPFCIHYCSTLESLTAPGYAGPPAWIDAAIQYAEQRVMGVIEPCYPGYFVGERKGNDRIPGIVYVSSYPQDSRATILDHHDVRRILSAMGVEVKVLYQWEGLLAFFQWIKDYGIPDLEK